MKISELITQLEAIKAEHGDIAVTIPDENGEADEFTWVSFDGKTVFLCT